MIIEGYTVTELAEKTSKSRHAVEQWLSSHNIKPVVSEVLYPLDTLNKLLEAPRGRPRKQAGEGAC